MAAMMFFLALFTSSSLPFRTPVVVVLVVLVMGLTERNRSLPPSYPLPRWGDNRSFRHGSALSLVIGREVARALAAWEHPVPNDYQVHKTTDPLIYDCPEKERKKALNTNKTGLLALLSAGRER